MAHSKQRTSWPTAGQHNTRQRNTMSIIAALSLLYISSGSAILFFIFHRANKKENPPIYITNEDGDDVCDV